MTATLRTLLARGKTLVAPGASDALSARLIEAHGYECVYIGSYATAASRFAMPDTGLLSLEQLAAKTAFAAVHIEDHTGAGKHTSGPQQLTSREETAERIRAAVAARRNPDFLIVARSDAFWVHSDLEDCIARLELYAAAGADMLFPTMVGPAELAEVHRRLAKPLMIVNNPEGQHAGAAIVLYYAFSVTRQFAAMKEALANRELASDTRPLEDFLGYKDAPGRSS